MRILSIEAENFGSYKRLDYEFSSKGLTLISGPTGAGKSTFCDLVPWALFGVTAKNGTADEIRSWNAAADTVVTIHTNKLSITRTRGVKNDLYYKILADEEIRGKDLKDTQSQINNILGIDADTYLACAYLHEFSKISQFFNTTAKIRRQITEELADLSEPVLLKTRLSTYSKSVKASLTSVESQLLTAENNVRHTKELVETQKSNSSAWDLRKISQLEALKQKAKTFQQTKLDTIERLTELKDEFEHNRQKEQDSIISQIEQLQPMLIFQPELLTKKEHLLKTKAELKDERCHECGNRLESDRLTEITQQLADIESTEMRNLQAHSEYRRLDKQLHKFTTQVNPYVNEILVEIQKQDTSKEEILDIESQINPFLTSINSAKTKLDKYEHDLITAELSVKELKSSLSDAELFDFALDSYRANLLQNSVCTIQDNVNSLLANHFDSELRLELTLAESDKLDVVIYKDGNLASFTQLSKGQRQSLKLCFGISTMKQASNASGVDFNCLWLDECLDGMSEDFKMKAFNMLESLAVDYDNVFLVEHSENLKTMFANKLEISLTDGASNVRTT